MPEAEDFDGNMSRGDGTRRYYRTVTRRQDDAVFITMPSENVVPGRSYEIRDEDKETILAVVDGQDLLDARREQLEGYLAADSSHTNIRLVDVSHLIDAGATPNES